MRAGCRFWVGAVLAFLLTMALAAVSGSPAAAGKTEMAGKTGPAGAAAVPPVASAAGQFYGAHGRMADQLTIAKATTATVDVTGVAGVPATGVATVALNIAVTAGSAGANQLIVYPSGAAEPADTTFVRYRSGIYLQNLAMVKVGTDGKIKIANKGSVSAIVYADVHGYTLTAAGAVAGSTFVPVRPTRLVQNLSVPANGSATLSPLGAALVPATGVSHVAFTMNAKSTTAGKLHVYPSGTTRPVDTNLDYGLGLWMQNQVIGRPGTDGKLTVFNSGTKAVLVDVHVTGYFATPQAAAAGSTVQPLQPARYVNRVSLAAQGTLTVAPLGAGGVPAAGVSGVDINVTTQSTGTGNIRIYPSGTDRTNTHAVAYHANQVYSGAITAKLGLDGKVTILNDGTVATFIWVDVYAYFKTPAGCALATAAAARTASIPTELNSRTSVIQASLAPGESERALEYAYTDNINRLVHGHQDFPDQFLSVQWTVISGAEAYTGPPGPAEQQDGRLQLVAHNKTGTIWSVTQATKEPPAWGPWAGQPQEMASHATVARQEDTLVTFAVDAAGALWALPQTHPNGPYGDWIKLGSTGLTGTPVVAEVDGGLQVFVLDSAGTWRTGRYARGTLSGCTGLGGSGFTGTASVVVFPGSNLRVLARAADGSVQTKIQDDTGAFPAAWDTVGTFTAAGSPSAVLSPAGRTEIVARGTDGRIWSTGETAQGTGAWRDWIKAQADDDPFMPVTDPAAFTYTGARATWAFVVRDADQAAQVYTPRGSAPALTGGASGFVPHRLPSPPAE